MGLAAQENRGGECPEESREEPEPPEALQSSLETLPLAYLQKSRLAVSSAESRALASQVT